MNLKSHIASVHEGRKPNECSICDYSFYLKRDMKNPIALVHEGKKSIQM